jgi:FMN-dependent NADH-azoreductase
MQTILSISVSPKREAAISTAFGREVVGRLRLLYPDAAVAYRDLSANSAPLVDAAFCRAITNPGDDPAAFETSEALITELERADALVLATPMHNYSVPAVLKAWIDQVVRIHRSFASTSGGKVGLLRDRPVYVVIASGGWFTGPSPAGAPAQPDFLTPYLRAILGTIGLRQVHFLTLEGVTRGPDVLDRALTRARAVLDQVLPVTPR